MGGAVLLLMGGLAAKTPWQPPVRMRDRDAINEMMSILRGLPDIDQVVEGDRKSDQVGSQYGVVAYIKSMNPQTMSDQNPKRKLRIGNYQLEVEATARTSDEAYEILDRLDSVIHNKLEQKDYGFCVPFMSVLSDASYDYTQPPAVIMTMRGQFAYNINVVYGFDENA